MLALLLLLACGEGDPADTSSDTSDTAVDEPATCDQLSPYRGCTSQNVLSTNGAENGWRTQTWDGDGHLVLETRNDVTYETELRRTEWTYEDGRVTTMLDFANYMLQEQADYSYDDDGNLIRVEWSHGRVQAWAYDDQGRLSEHTDQSQSGTVNVCAYSWTGTDQAPTSKAECTNGWSAETRYDERGLVVSVVSQRAGGGVTTAIHTHRGDCQIEQIAIDADDGAGQRYSVAYDADGRAVTITTESWDPAGTTSTNVESRAYTCP